MISVSEYFNQIIYPRHPHLGYFPDEGEGKVVCPFHDDVNPSLGIVPNTQIWHCFGCGLAGDVVEMHRRYLGMYHGVKLERWVAEDDLRDTFDLPARELKVRKAVPSSALGIGEFRRRLSPLEEEWSDLLLEIMHRNRSR